MAEVVDLEKHLREWNLHQEAIFARLDGVSGVGAIATSCSPYGMVSHLCGGIVKGTLGSPLDTSKVRVWADNPSLAEQATLLAREVYKIGYEFAAYIKEKDGFVMVALSEAIMIHILTYFGGEEAVRGFHRFTQEVEH